LKYGLYRKGWADKIGTVFFCKEKTVPRKGNGFVVFNLVDSRAGHRESRGGFRVLRDAASLRGWIDRKSVV